VCGQAAVEEVSEAWLSVKDSHNFQNSARVGDASATPTPAQNHLQGVILPSQWTRRTHRPFAVMLTG
jgi:hypothetical protein